MRLVEQHIIKRSSVYYNELQDLLHKCKNLYNKGLYVVRQYYFQYNDDNTVRLLYTILHHICCKTYTCYLISHSSFLILSHSIESYSPLFRTRRLSKRGL